jgi:hypothetical protein
MDGPFKCMETRINPYMLASEAVFVNLLKEPRNWFPAWRANTNRDVAPAFQAENSGGIDYLQSIPGLPKRLHIRAQERTVYHTVVSTSLSLSGL